MALGRPQRSHSVSQGRGGRYPACLLLGCSATDADTAITLQDIQRPEGAAQRFQSGQDKLSPALEEVSRFRYDVCRGSAQT